MPLIDSPPFDSIIVRGIAFRQRPSRSQKTSIENSSPSQACCTIDVGGRVAEEEVELARGRRRGRCAASRSRGAPSRAPGSRSSPGSSSGSHVGGVAIPVLLEEAVRLVLVLAEPDRLRARAGARARRARPAAPRAAGGRGRRAARSGVRRAARRARAARRCSRGLRPRGTSARRSASVERGRELAGVGRERRRAGAGKGGDDVDALARAGEEDDRHAR